MYVVVMIFQCVGGGVYLCVIFQCCVGRRIV